MAGETVITVVGNLVDDPELRFTPSGAAVAKFRVASTPRTFDRQTNEWKDGESLFLTCSVWRQAAENVAESLQRGMRVIVQGRLKQRSYENREGVKRTVYELDVDEVGAEPAQSPPPRSPRRDAAPAARATRRSGGGQGGGDSGGGGGQQQSQPANDPWATSAPAGGGQQQPSQPGNDRGPRPPAAASTTSRPSRSCSTDHSGLTPGS